MSDQPLKDFAPDTQKQRWVKYGLNVALSTIVVIALAILMTYLAQRPKIDRRIDTTSSGSYSLKPQTKNLIRDLKQKVKLVSLYQEKDALGKDNANAGQIRDLLEEYSRNGSNVEVDSIDPIKQPAKTDALIKDAIDRYGGAVKSYQDFVKAFQAKSLPELQSLVSAETAALGDLQTDSFGRDKVSQNAADVVATIREQLPTFLTRLKDHTDRALKAKFPDYRAIVDQIKESLDRVSEIEIAVLSTATKDSSNPALPEAYRKYLSGSVERHDAIKKLVDEISVKIGTLGELKVGELQTAIKGQDLVLVLGDKEWRVLNADQIWVTDSRDLRGFGEGQKLKPRFAGEQAVTSAILAVTAETKSKVAFVRAGGAPLTNPGFPPFQRGGPLSDVADRLRAYNFDVVEKDLSGQYAMQAQMQGGEAPPEPSDAELKNAIWIVIDTQQAENPRFGQAPPSIDPRVAAHIKAGGSAMILATPQADAMTASLKDFGLELQPDAVIVHEVPKGAHPQTKDLADEAQWLPFVFVVNEYGDQTFTSALKSLDSILIGAIPVKTDAAPAGVKSWPILAIPQVNPIWGEKNIDSANGDNLSYDKASDIPGPLFAGAAAESANSRIVVFGSLQGFMNQILAVPDRDLLARGVVVSRFPGNSEMFTNAVFWLARMDTMIAISPQAMEVPRISSMTDGTLNFWRIGVLIIGLPGLVIAAGVLVFLARRD